MPDYKSIEPMSKEQGQETVEKLGMIEGIIKRWKEKDVPVIISISEAESALDKGINYFTLSPGTYTFDFYQGEIIAPGQAKVMMSTALKNFKKEYMHSMRLFTDHDVLLSFEHNENTMFIGGETISMRGLQFQSIYITATVETNIRLMASTGDGLIEFDMITPPTTHSPLYDVDGSVVQTVSLDLGIFSRTNIEIVSNCTVATPFIFEASMDNEHWFTIESFGAATNVHKGYLNAFRFVRLKSIPAGGRLSMLITASRGM